MPYAQGIKKTDDVRDTVTINSLLTTSDSAYSKVDVNSGAIEKTDDDIDGPFDLGVSITETLDDDKETQIVYYTSSNLMHIQLRELMIICSFPPDTFWLIWLSIRFEEA